MVNGVGFEEDEEVSVRDTSSEANEMRYLQMEKSQLPYFQTLVVRNYSMVMVVENGATAGDGGRPG